MNGAGAARMQCTSVVLPSDDKLEVDKNEAIDDSAGSDWIEALSSAEQSESDDDSVP